MSGMILDRVSNTIIQQDWRIRSNYWQCLRMSGVMYALPHKPALAPGLSLSLGGFDTSRIGHVPVRQTLGVRFCIRGAACRGEGKVDVFPACNKSRAVHEAGNATRLPGIY